MWPEPSRADHLADWNIDWDEDAGEWVCSCTSCLRRAKEEDFDDYEYHYRSEEL